MPPVVNEHFILCVMPSPLRNYIEAFGHKKRAELNKVEISTS